MYIAIQPFRNLEKPGGKPVWLWMLFSTNNRMLGFCSRSYPSRSAVIRAAQRILDHAIFDMDIIEININGKRKPRESEKDQHYGR